ncbi:MAG TPA: RHS repeat-associated core domain-containing protein [Capsulimonadaceae bacterium]
MQQYGSLHSRPQARRLRGSALVGDLATTHGFVGGLGHPTDSTGLVHMRARYYDPACGRFVSEDPAASGANLYVYADDDPVTGCG